MKITNKIHRVTSIIAAVLLILSVVSSLLGTVRNLENYISNAASMLALVFSLVGNAFSVMFAVILLRGKKDMVSGILVVLSALYAFLGVFSFGASLLANAAYGGNTAYFACSFLVQLLTAAFRICIAIECFAYGTFSKNASRVILIILPILNVVLNIVSNYSLAAGYLQDGDFSAVLITFLSFAFSAILGNVPAVLMGISFSIPVKEYTFDIH